MQFRIDENLPSEVADALRAAGQDAMTVPDQNLSGANDPSIADVCQRERRALVTMDLDFANIYAYPPADYPGIIVLRFAKQDTPYLLQQFSIVLAALEIEPLDGCLWIVEEGRIRIRN